MIRSSLYDYSDAYIFVKGTTTVPNTAAAGAVVNNTNKKVVFKNCAPFSSCITEINNTQVDYAKYINIVMSMYNLIEYSNVCSKTSGSLWQYHRDEPAIDNNDNIVSLKYLSDFWRTLEVPLINCEITFQLTCSKKSFLAASTIANQVPKLKITGTKLYVPVTILSTQENLELLKLLESGFKRTINWNIYHSKKRSETQDRYLNVLIDPSFQGEKIFFVLSFKGDDGRKSYKQDYLPTVEIKAYNVVIDERNFFDQPVKNDLKTLKKLQLVKVMITQLDVY